MEGVKDRLGGLEASIGAILAAGDRAAAAEAALEASRGGAIAAAVAARSTAFTAGQSVSKAVKDLRGDVSASVGHVEECLAVAHREMSDMAERVGGEAGAAVVREEVTPALAAIVEELTELKSRVDAVCEHEEEAAAAAAGGTLTPTSSFSASQRPFIHSPTSPRSPRSVGGREGEAAAAAMAAQLATLTAQMANLQGEVVALKALQAGSQQEVSVGEEEGWSDEEEEEGEHRNKPSTYGFNRTGLVAFPAGTEFPGAGGGVDMELSVGEVLLVGGGGEEGTLMRVLPMGRMA